MKAKDTRGRQNLPDLGSQVSARQALHLATGGPDPAIGAFRILRFIALRHGGGTPANQLPGGRSTRISRMGDLTRVPSATPPATCFTLIPGARPAGGTAQL
jgi:hypothetical protein